MNETSPAFQNAVHGLLSDEHCLQLIELIKHNGLGDIFKLASGNNWTMSDHVSDDEFNQECYSATIDADAFDSLNYKLSMRLAVTEKEITVAMRRWISGVLAKQFRRPKSSGGPNKYALGAKGIFTASLVHQACQFGLKRTRNEASEPLSACDAVVHVLAQHGHHVTYGAVVKAWDKYAQVYMKL